MQTKEHVVVIGGGFAGLEVIKHLNRSNQFKITLVDLNNYNFSQHYYIILLLVL